MYIENRSEKLTVNKSNKNDVIRIMGTSDWDDQSSGDSLY